MKTPKIFLINTKRNDYQEYQKNTFKYQEGKSRF